MNDKTSLSVYLRSNTIRVYKSTIRMLGTPKYIQFRVHSDGNSIIVLPYPKQTFTSFRVPKNIYDEDTDMEVHSKMLCEIIAQKHNWDKEYSYRVPGRYVPEQNIVIYDFKCASIIPQNNL